MLAAVPLAIKALGRGATREALARAAPVVASGVQHAIQSYTDGDGNTVFRYGPNGETWIDRYWGGQWHTYGPY